LLAGSDRVRLLRRAPARRSRAVLRRPGPGGTRSGQGHRWHPLSELTASARTSLWGGMARKPGSSGRG